MLGKKVVTIIVIIIVIISACSAVILLSNNRTNLQVVNEDIQPSATVITIPTPTPENNSISQPLTENASDNEDENSIVSETPVMAESEETPTNLINENDSSEPAEQNDIENMTKDELTAMLDQKGLNNDQIMAIKIRLKELDEKHMPESPKPTQKATVTPIEPTTTAPKKDANGFIYTKEEAIQIFATEFQKLKEAGDFNYTYAYDTAIEDGRSTEESFASDLRQLLTNPYSSKLLSLAFDSYRRNGDISYLIGEASFWLSMGGDDGEYSNDITQ